MATTTTQKSSNGCGDGNSETRGADDILEFEQPKMESDLKKNTVQAKKLIKRMLQAKCQTFGEYKSPFGSAQ
eukprot:c44146_g1_i1 orf=124-339(+)